MAIFACRAYNHQKAKMGKRAKMFLKKTLGPIFCENVWQDANLFLSLRT